MQAPRIVGISLRHPGDRKGDPQFVADFTVEAGPITIIGATLIRLPDGELRILFPHSGRDRRVSVRREYRTEILNAALAAYRALTGAPADAPLATTPNDGASGQ